MQRNLSKVTLVIELDDGTRDKIQYGWLVPVSTLGETLDKQREKFALGLGEQMKQDFIRYMYDVVWAE